MITIDFTKVKAQISFDGTERVFNTAKTIGNAMMYNGSVLLDIGFEDLARKIYYSTGDVEVPEQYAKPIIQVISESDFIAAIKRTLIQKLNGNG